MQQSAAGAQLLPFDEKSLMQLLLPQVRFPLQWESKSQSPPPTEQGLELEQQVQSVLGIPSQAPVGGLVVVAAESAVIIENTSSNMK